jgi:hypothetical protein
MGKELKKVSYFYYNGSKVMPLLYAFKIAQLVVSYSGTRPKDNNQYEKIPIEKLYIRLCF